MARINMLNLVNYKDFPGDSRYRVFFFKTREEADTFEEHLRKKDIWYERSLDNESEIPRYLFGVHKDDFNLAQKANFLTNAQYRKPFLPKNAFRYLLLVITLGAIVLAIIGYHLVN